MKKALTNCLLILGLILSSCSDPCDDVNCQNGSSCDDGTCLCKTGYSGNNCEIENRMAFIGTWKGMDVCSGENPVTIELLISASADAVDKVNLSLTNGISFEGTITSPTTLLIPQGVTTEPMFNLESTYSGDASLDENNVLMLNLEQEIEIIGTKSCVATLTK